MEHTYIDFKWLIIGGKIKNIEDPEAQNFRIDDAYIANLMMQDVNQEFYMESSVIRIIEQQWVFSKKFNKNLFWFFVLCYILPYSITFVTKDQWIHSIVFNICVLPQLVLLSIEFLQMYENGLDYFSGWSFIDLG